MELIANRFDGIPISEQNLSQWRTHGYRRWQAYHIIMQETVELAHNSGEFEETGVDCSKMLLALKANYASMIQSWVTMPTNQMTCRREVFKHLTAAVLIQNERLQIERERLELLREKQASKSDASASSRPSRSNEQTPDTTDAANPPLRLPSYPPRNPLQLRPRPTSPKLPLRHPSRSCRPTGTPRSRYSLR